MRSSKLRPEEHRDQLQFHQNTGQISCMLQSTGLKESQLSPASLQWIDSGTRLLRGAVFIQAIKMWLGVLTTRARSARGRDLDSSCTLGCGVPGTLHHIIQVCPRVQQWRITRHNNMVNLMVDKLREKGLTVLKEPRIPTTHTQNTRCHLLGQGVVPHHRRPSLW